MATRRLVCPCGNAWDHPLSEPVPDDLRLICPACAHPATRPDEPGSQHAPSGTLITNPKAAATAAAMRRDSAAAAAAAVGPGHVIAGVKGKETVIGELDGPPGERLLRVAEGLRSAGLDVRVSDDIVATMWDKLMINVATGALAGITRLPYGGLYAVPEVEACALEAVREAMAVARAAGVAISWTEPNAPWQKAREGLPPEFRTSMLQSLDKGQRTEVDFINGSVVRWGERCGVPTPVNRALVACVKGIEHRAAHFADAR